MGLCIISAFCANMWQQLRLPFPQDYGEGLLWWLSAHIGDFSAVYKSLDTFPYVGTNYPPVYLWVSRYASLLTGDWLLAGRLISTLSTLGISGILAWMVCFSTPRKAGLTTRCVAATAAGAIPLATFTVNYWARFARVDMLALLFLYAGLAVFLKARKSVPGQFAAMAIFVLAAYTKQTTLVAPIVCILLVAVESRRRALLLAGFLSVLGGTLLLGLNWATHGGFLTNTIGYNLNPFDWSRLPGHWKRELNSSGPLLAAALAAAMLLVWRACGAGLRRSLIVSPFRRASILLSAHFAAAALQTLGIAKLGANVNYFLELDITACVLTSLLLFTFLFSARRPGAKLPTEQLAGLSFVLMVLLSSCWFVVSLLLPNPGENARSEISRAHFEELVSRASAARGPIYAEDLSVLMKAGRAEPNRMPETRPEPEPGGWAQVTLMKMIETQRFEMMIIENVDERERYTPPLTKAIRNNYVRVLRTSMGDVWSRKDH